MGWSTRELADLAGTTVNTIRHYHRLGLMAEPERRFNGYKQYEVRDLVKLLRIRRLVGLGVPLSQIGDVSVGEDGTRAALEELDVELAAKIDKLQSARNDIAAILRDGAPADAPSGFESVAAKLSDADSSILHIYTQLYDEEAMDDLRHLVEEDARDGTVSAEIDALPADADEATRQRLAEQLTPTLMKNLIDYPWLADPTTHLSKNQRVAQGTMVEAMAELYNPAQLDVYGRAGILARELLQAQRASESEET